MALTKLVENSPAPDFPPIDKEGISLSLADFGGKKMIVYFTPVAGAPGCPPQACDFRAMASLIEEHQDSKVAFTGEDRGMSPTIEQETNWCGIIDSFIDIGFIDQTSYQALPSMATASLTPTSVGPTNFPPLKAFQLGIPSLVSDRHHEAPISNRFVKVPTEGSEAWFHEMLKVIDAPLRRGRIDPDNTIVAEKLRNAVNKFRITESLMPQ